MISGKTRSPVALLVPLLLLAAGGCGSSSSSTIIGGGPDDTPPVVTASPPGGTYAGSQMVTLTSNEAGTAIYYTTDLSTPTPSDTLYTGTPIGVTSDTVLKFIGVDASNNTSDTGSEGYVIATSPIKQQWAMSGHGHISGEPWRHWDGDADGLVDQGCARCHSPDGFRDHAEDGVTDAAHAPGLGLECSGCHGSPFNGDTLYGDLGTYAALEPVAFPAFDVVNLQKEHVKLSLFGKSNLCISCHQGRSSTDDVDEALQAPGPYAFINIHYYAAAASYFGGEARGGYQYAGQDYVDRNTFPSHPDSLSTCVGCHMPNQSHTWEPDLATCTSCHGGASFETLGGSPGLNHQAIQDLLGDLLDEIQAYASGTVGVAIAYHPTAYPYFFKDTNGNGIADPAEANFGNRYTDFDASLLKAAYNYQVGQKEPCGYVHNGTYVRQILFDAVVDLGGAASVASSIPPGRPGHVAPAPASSPPAKTAQFLLTGHNDGGAEPFRHWDEDPIPDQGLVPDTCARCHNAAGFEDFVADGTVDSGHLALSVVGCVACHESANLFSNPDTRSIASVPFPSGDTHDFGNDSNLCASCHQGRESGLSVDAASANSVVQTPDYDSFDFVNRHYYAAGAILLGSDVTAQYEYAGRTYKGQNTYSPAHGGLVDCFGCHLRGTADHSFRPRLSDCTGCHNGIADFEDLGRPFGIPNTDWDGNGTGESFQKEIDGRTAQVLAAIQAYADTTLGSKIVYSGHAYPYFFKDTNGNGSADPGEDVFGNRYRDFDRTLLRAAYNFHSAQDPCGDMHNYKYVLQSLHDTLDDLDDGVQNDSPVGARP